MRTQSARRAARHARRPVRAVGGRRRPGAGVPRSVGPPARAAAPAAPAVARRYPMTATPQPMWQPAPTRPGMSAGRVVAVVFGVLVLLLVERPAAGRAASCSAADLTERTTTATCSRPRTASTGPGYALVSERIDLSTGADWMPVSAALGTARVEVTGTTGSETFVGIAPVSDATAYLGGVQRTVIDDLGLDSPGPRDCPGPRRPVRRPTRTSGRRRPPDRDPAADLGAGGGRLDARRHERRRLRRDLRGRPHRRDRPGPRRPRLGAAPRGPGLRW